MKKVIGVVFALAMLTLPAFGWNCSDPSAERVDVGSTLPAGATAGDGDGQYYKGTDAANPNDYYVCKVVTPTPPTTPTGGNSNASSTSNSNSTSSSTSTSKSGSQSSATGGAANSTSSATGGTATGGNSKSGVSNSGNSSNINNNTATGGQGGAGGQGGNGGTATSTATGGNQHQGQSQSNSLTNSGNSTATATGNGVGNGNNSNNSTSVTNVAATKIPVQTAVAPPVIPTVPCFKGFGAGVQTMAFGGSFGGGKVDPNCAILETSRLAPNRLSRCMVYITDKYAKAAGVTLEKCMQMDEQPEAPVSAQVNDVVPPQVQPVTINIQPTPPVVIPAPVVNIIASTPAPSVVVHAASKPSVPRSSKKCVQKTCPTEKPTVWNEDMVEGLQNHNKS
jgi:hypothetical protein